MRRAKIGADVYISLSATLAFGLLVSLIGRDWLVQTFTADFPASMAFTLALLSLGFFVHGAFLGSRNRGEAIAKVERERDEAIAEANDCRRRASDAEVKVQSLERALLEKGAIITTSDDDPSKLWRPHGESGKPASDLLRSNWLKLD